MTNINELMYAIKTYAELQSDPKIDNFQNLFVFRNVDSCSEIVALRKKFKEKYEELTKNFNDEHKDEIINICQAEIKSLISKINQEVIKASKPGRSADEN